MYMNVTAFLWKFVTVRERCSRESASEIETKREGV